MSAARHHRLAAAARSHAAPVQLCTGRFAPPDHVAIWHLPTPADHVVIVTAREIDGELDLRCKILGEGH